jgi:lipopolysaccharide biosynthesis glycosyltransferase
MIKKCILIIFLILFLVCINFKKKIETFQNENVINIVMSCDKNQFIGLIAIVNSIIQHTNEETKLFFNFLVDVNEKKILDNLIRDKLKLKKYIIKEIEIDKNITNNIRVNRDYNIKNNMNFARFNFHNEFPNLDKIIYLDVDMIVKAPIEELYYTCMDSMYPLSAVGTRNFRNSDDIYEECKKMYNLKNEYSYFNAGVYFTSLQYWRKNGVKDKIIEIMKKHKKSEKGLFKLGTQPILNIVFANNFQILDKSWNTEGLGYKKVKPEIINKAKILHWTGKQKPWLKNGRYKNLWEKYNFM